MVWVLLYFRVIAGQKSDDPVLSTDEYTYTFVWQVTFYVCSSWKGRL